MELSDSSNEIPENELRRIRSELRYAALVVGQLQDLSKPKSEPIVKTIFTFLGNGFVLLLVGSLITSVLVPQFQKKSELRAQRLELMRESFSQFLFYSNSIWKEFYSIIPLTQNPELTEDEYLKYLVQMTEIKLARYDSYARLVALAVVFRGNEQNDKSNIEKKIHQYAVMLNNTSSMIDKYLGDLYCTPTIRKESPCTTFDVSFDGFLEFEKIKKVVVRTGNAETERVSSAIIKAINQ